MKASLLIAETDADLRDAYDRLCSARGFQVETSADGLECLIKLGDPVPDVLVVDLDILWGGGDGVLACLREGSAAAIAPAVFVTGNDSPQVLSQRSGIPPGNCFQKPFRVSTLLDSVCTVLAVDR